MIGRDELAMMKPTAILVNAARGGVLDHDALVDALSEGTIWGRSRRHRTGTLASRPSIIGHGKYRHCAASRQCHPQDADQNGPATIENLIAGLTGGEMQTRRLRRHDFAVGIPFDGLRTGFVCVAASWGGSNAGIPGQIPIEIRFIK